MHRLIAVYVVFLFVEPSTHGNPRYGITPSLFSVPARVRIRWHRFLLELSGLERCRGIAYDLPPWFPLARHRDTMLIFLLVVMC